MKLVNHAEEEDNLERVERFAVGLLTDAHRRGSRIQKWRLNASLAFPRHWLRL